MKKMKKVLAMILSLAMILAMSATAFASGGNPPTPQKPTSNDKADVSVTGITQEGVTVTAYKVVEPNYNEYGFTGYSWVDGTGYVEVEEGTEVPAGKTNRPVIAQDPTASDQWRVNINESVITALAEKAANGDLGDGAPMTGTNGTYTANLPVGSYVVLVTGSNDTIYNPMLVGVYYTLTGTGQGNTVVGGQVSADDKWELFTQDGYEKSSTPTVTKKIKDYGNAGNENGNAVQVGTEIPFEITTKIPSYSDQYEHPKFIVSDSISDGLTYKDTADSTLTIKDKDGNIIDSKYYTNKDKDGNDKVFSANAREFCINFTEEFIEANPNKEIVIEYTAVLNENAVVNLDANTNTAKIQYSHNPDNDTDLKEKSKKTYHYTFGIDTALGGNSNWTTGEIFKVNENESKTEVTETGKTVTNPLAGAKFALVEAKKNADGTYEKDSNGKYVKATGEGVYSKEISSGTDGRIEFKGLGADKIYILEETEAPEGYSLEGKQHTVEVVDVTINDDGMLTGYSIKIDGNNDGKSTYSATYTKEDNGEITITADHTQEKEAKIKNTKLAELPSTGGIGTTIFTIGGCIIMIIAAGLFFASRRKKAEN